MNIYIFSFILHKHGGGGKREISAKKENGRMMGGRTVNVEINEALQDNITVLTLPYLNMERKT